MFGNFIVTMLIMGFHYYANNLTFFIRFVYPSPRDPFIPFHSNPDKVMN